MMNPILSTALFATFLTVALSRSFDLDPVVMESSPMPMPDPFSPGSLTPTSTPRLFLVQAGSPPFTIPMQELGASSTVSFCPSTFGDRGFSVKCLVDAPRVRFLVDEKFVNSERTMPFYLNGDSGMNIFKYKGEVGDGFRVDCIAPGVGKVYAELTVSC